MTENRLVPPSFCFWSIFVLACASLFWPGLFFGEVPAFRDAFHFYYPQAVWLDQCALQGEYFPQWQCNESLGVNVAGETTSALYYPLRVVWFLPILSVAQRFSLFVLVHLLLAGLSMQYACSRMQLRKEAGWLAGASFALSCPVLFQHNNLVFLSSAAWLGFALAELGCWLFRGDSVTRQPRFFVFSGAVAMMVLAGDPHTAVNIFIVAVFLIVAKGISKRSALWFGKSMVRLAAVVALAVGLSAVQSIQSLHWSSQSHRWSNDRENVELQKVASEQSAAPKNAAPMQLIRIMNEPARRPANAIYEFSLSPWHVLTGLWPTLGGQFSPENSRTFSFIPAEGRMWIPSLFFGIVPLLLLLGGFRSYPNSKYSFFLLAMIFALLASFGNYSLGWLLRCVLDAFEAYSLSGRLPPDHYSSLYGLLAEWLPGYSVFRYPAKWSVIVVACATLAAAIRFDQLGPADLTRLTLVQRIVLLLSGLGLLLTLAANALPANALAANALAANALAANTLAANTLAASVLLENFAATGLSAPNDVWLGLPIRSAMTQQLLIAFAIPILVLGLLAILRWREKCLERSVTRASLPVHALFAWIGLLETFVVATCWCSFVPAKTANPAGPWTSEFVWSDTSEANIERDQRLTSSTTSISNAITDYQREFALGKLGLLSSHHNLSSMLSIEPQRIKQLRIGLARVDNLSASQPKLDDMLAWLGVEKRLVRTTEVDKPASLDWKFVPRPKPLCELCFDDSLMDSSSATVKWRWIHCGQIRIDIDSPAKCQLIVRQFNDDGWHVRSNRETSPQLTRDTSGLFIECAVDSGKTVLTLQRIQWPLQIGIAISVASLLFALSACLFNNPLHKGSNSF